MKLAACAVAAAASGGALALTFADGEFGLWSGPYAQHRTSGGNPGAYLHWEGNIGGTPGSFILRRPDFVYDPGVQGAIAELRIALDSFRIEQGTPSYATGVSISQGGQDYVHFLPTPASSEWLHREAHGLTSEDFSPFFSGSGHPDFSASGGPMAFGIMVAFVSEGYPIVGGFDNYLVTTEPVPEPATLLALASGLLGLLRRGHRHSGDSR